MTFRAIALLVAVMLFAGCAGDLAFSRGEKYALEGDWDRAVAEYRQALRDDPENVSYKTRLTKALDMAATKHIERANHYIREGNPDAALYEAEQARVYSPANNKSSQLIGEARKLMEVRRRMDAGKNYMAAGRPNEAINQFYKVLDVDPAHAEARRLIEEITKRKVEMTGEDGGLSLASDQPVTLSFKEAKLKEVFEFLSKLSGISILFDEDVKNQTVTVFAREVSFSQALDLMLATNKLFYKKVSDDTIIIIPKTKSKQAQYQDLMMKTFYLSNTKAKDMVNILRTMLETRKVIINEVLNSITVRETPEKIELAEKLIEANDKKDAEVVIDVEVLAVDRSENLTYGIDLPKGVTATYNPAGGILSSIPEAIVTNITEFQAGTDTHNEYKDNVWFSYPSVTANWSQTKGRAETLTNPQIRTLNLQPAKILIGSRVPIQTGVTTGTTTQTTFEYREVGIRLNVEPDISLTNDITLKTTLEVSSLGESIDVGTTKQPTINTTTVEATLNLRDGETVIIGGLLENISAETMSGVAGVMDVPILGKIFSKNTLGPDRKRELVMTLTPHIVRSREMPRKGVTEFWSGTEEEYDNKPLFRIEPKRPFGELPDEFGEYRMREARLEKPAEPAPGAAAAPVPGTEPETKPETAPETKPETAPETKPETTPETKPETTPESKPDGKPEEGGETRPESHATRSTTYERTGRVGTLGFAPEVAPLDVGQEFTVDVVVEEMDTLFEAQLSVIYNPKLAQFVSATEGNVLNVDGAPTSFKVTPNDKVGFIDVFLTRLGRVPGISGGGTLFSLRFKGLAPGISPLVFKRNGLKDPEGNTVHSDLKSGTLYVR